MNPRFSKLRKIMLTTATLAVSIGAEWGWTQSADEELARHQELARQAEARQDFPTAIREYTFLVRKVPESAELRSNLGIALYFNHDLKPAGEQFRRAIAMKPGLYAPHLFLGMMMAHTGHPDEAVAELEKAEKLNAGDPVAHSWLGYEYMQESRFEKAAQQLETASRQNSGDQDVWFALGRCYLELGKIATTHLLQLAPDGARAWQLAAEQYEAQGNKEKALSFYAGALQRRPGLNEVRDKVLTLGGTVPAAGSTSAHFDSREDEFYKQVQIFAQRSRAAFERISQIDPDSYRAHQVLGDSAAASERSDEAAREYRIVIEKKPDLPGVHGDLCNALSRTAQVDAAVKACDEEVSLSPYSSDAYVEAARAHLLANDETHAAGDLKRALELNRPPVAAYKLLAKIEIGHSEYAAAIRALTRYTAVESRDASAYFMLARAYKAVGEREKMNQAIEAYKKNSQFAKDAGEAQRTLNHRNDENIPPEKDGMGGGNPD